MYCWQVTVTDRFVDTYFSNYPGYYDTMDAGVKDEHGYIKVHHRRFGCVAR